MSYRKISNIIFLSTEWKDQMEKYLTRYDRQTDILPSDPTLFHAISIISLYDQLLKLFIVHIVKCEAVRVSSSPTVLSGPCR